MVGTVAIAMAKAKTFENRTKNVKDFQRNVKDV